MPTYKFACTSCDISWEKLREVSEVDKSSMCPKCYKKGQRNFEIGSVSFRGIDFSTNQNKAEDYARHGMDKGQADTFYKESIDATKERMKTGFQHYAAYTPNYEKLGEEGKLIRQSPEKARQKKETMKKMTECVYKKAGLDVTKPNNPSQNL
tara:strand:- start:2909 stop:3364 length:456 start_codon:yes stop_codon:yes gene_type:complete